MACQALTMQGLPRAVLPVLVLGACWARLCALVKVAPLLKAIKQLPRVVAGPVPAKWAITAGVKPRMLAGLLNPVNLTSITLCLPPWAAINALTVALQTWPPACTHRALLVVATVLGKAWGAKGAPATVPTKVVFLTAISKPLFKPTRYALV